MYLIGLMIWVVLSGGIAYGIAGLLAERLKFKWWRKAIAAVLFPIVCMAPLSDEIVGKYQFDQLCENAKEVRIHGTIPVGDELYTSDGKWRGGGTTEEELRLREIYSALVVMDSTDSTAENLDKAMPIRHHHFKILERSTGRLLVEWDQFGTSGGMLARHLGGPILTKAQCSPPALDRPDFKMKFLPFRNAQGVAK